MNWNHHHKLGATRVAIATVALAISFVSPASAENWQPHNPPPLTLEEKCDSLWKLFDQAYAMNRHEAAKPGITPGFRRSARMGEATGQMIKATGCPISDPEGFDLALQAFHTLNGM
jgi:hypothetical protein